MTSRDDLIRWADGTTCRRDELGQYGHMSDDYEVVPVDSLRAEEAARPSVVIPPDIARDAAAVSRLRACGVDVWVMERVSGPAVPLDEWLARRSPS